ncbi:3-beta hydroxysteroid dehydrogenase [Fructilactobacillus lindneri]|uniref:Short-chain alcohol dehydrogenase n=2 Tax=Fructilactobacillus lindneri TaxID=53444 RepID=A0A0R2JSD5_9LACO|nr:glucose 1-dehydrogenase [Fructilactobacillus lindneri]ANZ58667.1 3-beta hydroxysteroid dehydrogenase [Fructilactobacillus lindneri]KRN80009.1 Short-chain alcohol dehydrogenase [Fructilactobacillus lindneri DSM 20690 = JCM 11027]POG97886.1 3-beta hydroxysteroid dehydrogenase [Fructilactobacillus lindneri]POG99218.1 3-beta hydroxysteroid dehydrogenase [Fructilactobacillus lindneri]POH01855.1 3-beta hydroxysteroid dehydrogenase [Fructilactobacillus lindneri]
MSQRLTGKVAIITGGSKGIGFATARRFAQEGAAVVITARNETEGNKAATAINQEFPDSVKFKKQDVSNSERWTEIFAETKDDFGPVTTLVNNAGIGIGKSIEETTDEEWQKVIGIDLTGTFYGIREGIRQMKNKNNGASIINISSIEGIVGDPILGAYNASKGGVKMMSKSAALDCALKDYGVRVNCVNPGYIKTPMISDELDQYMSQRSKTPMGHLGKPDDIAYACVYLASDESAFTTGSEMVVDGGYTAQ